MSNANDLPPPPSPQPPQPLVQPPPPPPRYAEDPTRYRKRLALASFLLSFTPLVVWVLTFAFRSLLFPSSPYECQYHTGRSCDYSIVVSNNTHYLLVTALVGVVSLVGSISAIVTANAALGRAKQLPQQQQAWQGLAQAGKVLGILGIVADCVVAPCTFVSLWGQTAQIAHVLTLH